MIKAILLLVVALSGCATPKAPSETCVNAGKYAFTMAMLREGGIPLSTVERYSSRPVVVPFPVDTIRDYVMADTF